MMSILRSPTLHQWLPLAVVALVLMASVLRNDMNSLDKGIELDRGCDAFGYHRQAELFREKGFAGFDTKLSTPTGDKLLALAQASGIPTERWYEAVAPHCHHYKQSVGHVVLQYPPGTGFLLSLFPAQLQGRMLKGICIVLTAGFFAFLIGRCRQPLQTAGTATAAMLTLAAMTIGSESVAPGVLLSAVTGAMLPSLAGQRWGPMVALGLLTALSASIRLPNLVLCGAAGLILLADFVRQRARLSFRKLLAFSVAAAIGLIPLLWANYLNTGSPLRTTYNAADASAPRFGLDQFWRGLQFYLSQTPSGLIFAVASLAAVAALVMHPRSRAILAAAVALSVSALYLLPKEILIDYYLLCPSVFALTAIVGDALSRPAGIFAPRGSVFAAVLLGVGALLMAWRDYPRPENPIDPAVVQALKENPIVWGDFDDGRFVSIYGAWTARPHFTGPDTRETLFRLAESAGIPQLFVADSDTMRRILPEIMAKHRLEKIGTAFGDQPVYRLIPGAPGG